MANFMCIADQDHKFWEETSCLIGWYHTQSYVKNGPWPRHVLNPEDIRDWITNLLIMYSQLDSKR